MHVRLNLADWLTMIPPLLAMACVVGLTNGATAAAHALTTISPKRLSTGGTSVFGTTTLTFLIAGIILHTLVAHSLPLGTRRERLAIG